MFHHLLILRGDLVIPVPVEVIPVQVDLSHVRVGDFDPRWIRAAIRFRLHLQPFARGGSGNQADDHLQAGQRSASPVLADKGEQPVFNLCSTCWSREGND